MRSSKSFSWGCLTVLVLFLGTSAEKDWKKKDVRDYNDADLERLLEQWEEDEDPLPDDELPEWDPRKKPNKPQINMDDIKNMDPEALLQQSKKGQTVMAFVKVKGTPTKEETEQITSIWQTGLYNSHIHLDRYPLDDGRCIFMFKDGALAWEAKDFLIEQEQCQEVQIEQRVYHGKHTEEYKAEVKANQKATKTKSDKAKKQDKKKDKKKDKKASAKTEL